MNILAIDTSNHVLGVAIMKDEQIAGEVVTNLAKNHSVRLMPAIDKLMKEVQIEPEQLDKIVVAKGPGSYTGVRIGIATAKSMAWALQIPIVGVSSLEILSFQGRFFNGAVCPFFDARRGLVYTSLYKWKHNKLETIYKETNSLMEGFLKTLAEEGEKVLFLSPDISLHQKAITQTLGELAVIPEGPYHIARPAYLALAGSGRESDNLHTLTPNYLRLAEAEANWKKAQKEKQ